MAFGFRLCMAEGLITTRDGIAHLQLGNPDDISRIGRDHLYIAYT
jgi:hypothetical protein